jgi:outer membrane receptor for Fe3+-dicitrate
MPVHSWESLVGSHRRLTSGHIEPIGAFDSSVLPGIQTQPDTSTGIRNLVRIEGVRGSNPLSSTEFLQVKRPVRSF